MFWRRPSVDVPFEDHAYLRVPEHGYIYRGMGARYLETTRELFFVGPDPPLKDETKLGSVADWRVWVLRNFDLPVALSTR